MTQPPLSPDQIEKLRRFLSQSADLSAASRLHLSGIGRVHLSPARANLVRHLDLAGREILELGGGCGGLSRFLAEKASRLVVVEEDAGLRTVLQERLRDRPEALCVAEAPDSLFDLVVLVEAPGGEAQSSFDQRLGLARRHLRPNGRLAMAVNNRLGLGAWTGQPDPRTGFYFSAVAGGLEPNSWRSRREWLSCLAELGLVLQEEYLLSPDVWLPTCVLREELLRRDTDLAADLLCHQGFADTTLPAFPLLPAQLLAASVGRAGLLADFAPGFFWLLGNSEAETEKNDPLALGWHYASERRPATCTRFFLQEEEVWVAKKGSGELPAGDRFFWRGESRQKVLQGQRWRQRLIVAAYHENGRFEDELYTLLEELRDRFLVGPEHLEGKALDAILTNAVLQDGSTQLFDLEWELQGELPASWWVLRNVLALVPNLDTVGRGIGASSLAELYLRLCHRLGIESALEADIRREAELQLELASGGAEGIAEALRVVLEKPLRGFLWPPRDPQKWSLWQEDKAPWLRAMASQEAALAEAGKLNEGLSWLANVVTSQQRSLAGFEAALASQQRSLESIDAALRWLAEKVAEKGGGG